MTLADRVTAFDKFMGDMVSDEFRCELINRGFFTAPASTKYHGSYEGGLFDHSLTVAQFLVELTEKNDIPWTNERSPYIVGMFHDLCKMDNYVAEIDGFRYNEAPLLRGHGDKSVMLLAEHMKLTEEEILCIRYHMGAFVEKEEWRDYTRAVNKYASVLWTHHADMLATFSQMPVRLLSTSPVICESLFTWRMKDCVARLNGKSENWFSKWCTV